MGSGTEDTPWRDHDGDDGAGQTRMPTSAVLSTARQIGVRSSVMAAMSHTCIGNDESVWQSLFVVSRVVLSEHTSSSYTVLAAAVPVLMYFLESTRTGTFKYFHVTSISYNESTWTKFMQTYVN